MSLMDRGFYRYYWRMSKKNSKKKAVTSRVFATNRKAFHDYEIEDRIEAGIVLNGGEVKSVKTGQASIKEAFIYIDAGEAWLMGAHIPPWVHTGSTGYDPIAKRKLLLHRGEIDSLLGKTKEKGWTLIPLKLYGQRGRVKVEIGVGRGRKKFEKKQREKERFLKRELHKARRDHMV